MESSNRPERRIHLEGLISKEWVAAVTLHNSYAAIGLVVSVTEQRWLCFLPVLLFSEWEA